MMYLLFLLAAAADIKGVYVCNINICLTWTVQKDHLDLTCKVNVLKYTVEFYNNQDNEQGYCLHPKPSPKCIPLHKNTMMTQNATTNVTYLKVSDQIDSHLNGKWECRHGTNRDRAFVNVTVLKDKKGQHSNSVKCWQSYLAYAMVGFGFTILIFTVTHIVCLCHWKCLLFIDKWYQCAKQKMNICCKGFAGGDVHKIKAMECGKMFLFLFGFIILFIIPVRTGFHDDNICKGDKYYAIPGIGIAFLFLIHTVRVNKKTQAGGEEVTRTSTEDDADGHNGERINMEVHN